MVPPSASSAIRIGSLPLNAEQNSGKCFWKLPASQAYPFNPLHPWRLAERYQMQTQPLKINAR